MHVIIVYDIQIGIFFEKGDKKDHACCYTMLQKVIEVPGFYVHWDIYTKLWFLEIKAKLIAG